MQDDDEEEELLIHRGSRYFRPTSRMAEAMYKRDSSWDEDNSDAEIPASPEPFTGHRPKVGNGNHNF
jgi:hypothetical protein